MIKPEYYSSYLEVDLGHLRRNTQKVLSHLNGRCSMIPVVKANAYSMGIGEITRLLTAEFNAEIVGVAQIYEGLLLRQKGFTCDILVMGGAMTWAIPRAVEHGLSLDIFTLEQAQIASSAAIAAGTKAKIHIKLDTGMNRLGVKVGDDLEALIKGIKNLKGLEIAGVFTHFATSFNYNDKHTLEQFGCFKQGVTQIRDHGINPQYIHCCNSGATIWLEEALDFSTHVRPGSLYMGYDMMADLSNPLKVVEPMSWRAFVTNIHDVHEGEGVGYGRHFAPTEKTTVATVSVGYGDGLFRPMSQGFGPVYLNETKTKYLATCMDQCFIDATGIDCNIGDEVTIIGHTRGGKLLSAFEIEAFTGQCYQNALCSINERVVRIYKE